MKKYNEEIFGGVIASSVIVPTIDGAKEIGGLSCGDFVFHSDGSIGLITSISDQFAAAGYQIDFDSGENIVVGSGVLLNVYDRIDGSRGQQLTSDQLFENRARLMFDGRSRFVSNNIKPVNYPNTKPNALVGFNPINGIDDCIVQGNVVTRFNALDRIVNDFGVVIKRTQTFITIPEHLSKLVEPITNLANSLGFKVKVTEMFTGAVNIFFNISQSENERTRGVVKVTAIPNVQMRSVVVDRQQSTLAVTQSFIPIYGGCCAK